MKQRRKEGRGAVRQGDEAEHLYILVEGSGAPRERRQHRPGQMFGEIAFFAPEKRRTLAPLRRGMRPQHRPEHRAPVYYQNPGFGFEISA